jgi:hypothetical protein
MYSGMWPRGGGGMTLAFFTAKWAPSKETVSPAQSRRTICRNSSNSLPRLVKSTPKLSVSRRR